MPFRRDATVSTATRLGKGKGHPIIRHEGPEGE